MKKFVMKNPEKVHGEFRLQAEISHCILATDFKSPPVCLIVYEEDGSDKHDR